MKVILLQDIKGVGKAGQIINASDGHARNYLIPRKLAVVADSKNLNELEAKNKKEDKRLADEFAEAQKIQKILEESEVKIKVKTGEGGRLFGSITNKEVSEAIKEKLNLDIDKKKITVKPIKMTGTSEASIKLHPKVTASLKVLIEALI